MMCKNIQTGSNMSAPGRASPQENVIGDFITEKIFSGEYSEIFVGYFRLT